MPANFYHITLVPRAGVTDEEVRKKFDSAVDWFSYAPNAWIVYTTSNAKKWKERLLPLVKSGGKLLICKLDKSDYTGWANVQLWEWLRQPRET